MRLGCLYSGGKDSTYSVARARDTGNEVVCLITLHPVADDSPLFHYPNSWITQYLADAMAIPLVNTTVEGRSKDDEIKALAKAISQAKSLYRIDGIVHGGIASNYQKQAFEEICSTEELTAIAPLWNVEYLSYLNQLVREGFEILVVGVSAMGLGKEWLGAMLDSQSLPKLERLSKKYGFNLAFEGGEGETLVTDCRLFQKRLEIRDAKVHWDGQRGIFEILEAALVDKQASGELTGHV